MRFLKRCYLVLWIACLATAAQAQQLAPEIKQLNLMLSAQYLEDPSGQLSLQDVRNMGAKFRAWSAAGEEVNFGFTQSAYWIRVPVQRTASAPKDWLLELHYTRINELDFYPPSGLPIYTGSSRPFDTRPYFDRAFVFPMEVNTTPEFFYLRAQSGYSLTIPLTLWQPNAYRQQKQRFDLLQYMYYGGLLVLSMYGLVVFLFLKDVRFLIYSGYIAATNIGMFASNGYGRQILWSHAPGFDEISQSFFFGLTGFFAILFARKLLLPPNDRSWLSRCMQLSQHLFILTCLLVLWHLAWPVWLPHATRILMFNAVIMGLLVGIASLRAYLEKHRGIRFFVVGWMALWLGVCVATFRAFGWLPSNGLTSYALQLSTVAEMVLMAMALGDLLRLEHEAHSRSQVETLTAKQALLDMSRASEETLIRAVKERTEQLQTSLNQEKHLREQYVRFGSMISHEFRTPLSIIQSQASVMRKEYEHGIDQILKRLDAIGSATQRLKVMFDKWLHSDSLNETLEILDRQPLALSAWVQSLVQSHAHLLLNHALELRLNTPTKQVLADPYHLGLALSNLIDNAAKYSPVDSTITIETRLKPGHVGIAVTDKGPGIPTEVQHKVFAEFFRASTTSHVRGVGLGLSIVQRIVQAHGGHVTLLSTPGNGASFCIWLPAS